MFRLLTCALAAMLLIGAAPALADPETTGGLPAGTPPVLSPQGGVADSSAAPPAEAARGEDEAVPTDEQAQPNPGSATPDAAAAQDDTSADAPLDPSPSTESAASAPPSSAGGDGGLPHTGFALAALVAIGIGFLLTGYALRYSRALEE